MLEYVLTGLYIISCIILILFVLLQPGKADAAAVFGGGANSTAFGPRGTQTVLAKVTVGAAIAFFLIAFLFSIPGLFGKRSVGQGVGPAQPANSLPAPPPPTDLPVAPSPAPATPQSSPSPAGSPGAATPNANKPAATSSPAANANAKAAAGNAGTSPSPAAPANKK